jgi:hypothetical protein
MKRITSITPLCFLFTFCFQVSLAQLDWPAGSGYTYFGAPTLNQSAYGNYAALQDKNNGLTFLNSPLEIRFRINNSDKMFLSNSGNFGIGTTVPGAPLHVVGSGQGSHLTIETNSNGEGDLTWVQAGAARAAFQVNQSSGDFEAWVSGSVWQRWLQVNRSSGNVGINTTPLYKFHVKNPDLQLVLQTDGTGNNRSIVAFGDAAGTLQGSVGLFGADGSIRIGDAMDYRIVVKQSSNVGIGTMSPSTNLEIVNSSGPSLKIRHASEQPTWGLTLQQLSNLKCSISAGGQDLTIAAGYSNKLVLGDLNYNTYGGSVIFPGGNVGIGTSSPDQKLTVNGTVHATRVKVETTVPGPDYVFEKSYSLPSLDAVKSYIDENKHLPEVPSAKEMEVKGIDVGEMNMLLLKKIEELTLYVIEQQKQIDRLNKNVNKE